MILKNKDSSKTIHEPFMDGAAYPRLGAISVFKETIMTIEEIILTEPKLIPILHEAYCHSTDKIHIKSRYWYKNLKPKMSNLVGFGAENIELSSTDVYEKTYRFLIKILGM